MKPSAAQRAAQLLDQYMERDVLRQLLREDRERRQANATIRKLIDGIHWFKEQARHDGDLPSYDRKCAKCAEARRILKIADAAARRLAKRKGDKHG